MCKKNTIENLKGEHKNNRLLLKSLPFFATGVFFIISLITSIIIIFPTLASNYASGLPVIKQYVKVQEDYAKVKQQMISMEQEIQKSREDYNEIKNENDKIQNMVINFIKAEYRNDTEAMKKMCTDEFKRELDKSGGTIVMNKSGNVFFSTVSDVVKQDGLYKVYVRVSDDLDDSEYQWNFEIKKVDGKFLVSYLGLDV